MAESITKRPDSWYYEENKAQIQCADCNILRRKLINVSKERYKCRLALEQIASSTGLVDYYMKKIAKKALKDIENETL